MDVQDSTAPPGLPDYDPPGADPYERGKRAGRRLGAYAALATARRCLRQAGPIELARILNQLVAVEDLGEVLRQLEDLADRAGPQ